MELEKQRRREESAKRAKELEKKNKLASASRNMLQNMQDKIKTEVVSYFERSDVLLAKMHASTYEQEKLEWYLEY